MAKKTKQPPKGKDAPVKVGPVAKAGGNPTPGGKIFGNKWARRHIRQVKSS